MFTTSVSFIGNIYRIQTLMGGIDYTLVTKMMQERLEDCANELKIRMKVGVLTNEYGLEPNSAWTIAAWNGTLSTRRNKVPAGGSKTPMVMSEQIVKAITTKEVSSRRIANNEVAYFIGVPRSSKLHRTDKRTKYGKLMTRLHQKPITIYGVTDINTREGGYVVHPFGNKSLTTRVPSRDFFTPALNKYQSKFQAEMYDGVSDAVREIYALDSMVGVTTLADLAALK